jgi:hypothetical protein
MIFIGLSVRNVHIMRQALSAALSRAVREELITRNIARMVELPAWEPSAVAPWSPTEALAFLQAAIDDPLGRATGGWPPLSSSTKAGTSSQAGRRCCSCQALAARLSR